jgi:penicillin-binding protein 1A
MNIIARLITALFLFSAFCFGIVFFAFTTKSVDLSALERYNPGQPTILLDDEGKEWARFQLDRREPVSIDRMPKHLIHAVLAAEDHEFFSHSGISLRGIARSLVVNLARGRRAQGASTITQQLVKLLFLDARKTFERKIKEQCYALLVECQFTKEQILETYLNHVYFGYGIYGVEAASQRFWGVSVNQITAEQAATLAGIIRCPSRYCPLHFPILAQQRRNIVLRQMRDLGFIASKDYELWRAKPLVLAQQRDTQLASHLKETLRCELEELVGRQRLYSGGLQVKTTISQSIQRQVQKVFSETVNKLKSTAHPLIDGALITMDTATGEIKGFIGGSHFGKSQWNRALQARRQLGSIFKPVVYAAAIERGYNFAQVDVDEPFELANPANPTKPWAPVNANGQFEGPMTLARALSISNNIVTIKTILNIGCDYAKSVGDRFHLPGLQPLPSLALGCVDVTLKEAVALFNVFANNGVYVEPHYLLWIKDSWGNKIYKYKSVHERIMDPKVSGQVTKVLAIGMDRLRTKLQGRWVDSDSIGKTGTTNDFRTSWFIGSTPELTTGIYIGRDDNQSMGPQMFARRTAFPIWYGAHKTFTTKKKQFAYDPALIELVINEHTGEPTDVEDPDHCCIAVATH